VTSLLSFTDVSTLSARGRTRSLSGWAPLSSPKDCALRVDCTFLFGIAPTRNLRGEWAENVLSTDRSIDQDILCTADDYSRGLVFYVLPTDGEPDCTDIGARVPPMAVLPNGSTVIHSWCRASASPRRSIRRFLTPCHPQKGSGRHLRLQGDERGGQSYVQWPSSWG
jgi:hypothetical protein